LQNITTINGLSGETITKIKYSEDYQLLMIGYENGLIEIVFDNDDEVLSVVDILEKETIAPNLKRINHFNEFNGLVYISTNYGVSVYDLERLEFGDTYLIGNGGGQIKVNQTTLFGDFIYAACGSNSGIKKASLSNQNLIDYQQWQTFIDGGNFKAIQSVGDRLYAVRMNKVFYEIVNDNLNQLFTYTDLPLDTREVNNNLIITTISNVFVYDSDYNLLSTASVNQEFSNSFSSATITNDFIFIGTMSFGVLKTALLKPVDYEVVRPDGPLMNNGFKIEVSYNKIWLTFGDYDIYHNPHPLRQYGLSIYKDEQWHNVPYDSLLTARNLTYTAVNPFDPNQVFISATHDGLLELNDDKATILYNETNSALESLVLPGDPNYKSIRVSGTQFDSSGLLWTITSKIDNPLKSFDPSTNQWREYSFEEVIPDGFNDELGFSDLVVDRNGTKWIGCYENGVIAYNENNNKSINRVYTLEQNMPISVTKSLAIDNRNQLWIGTLKGLRVLYNTSNFLDDPNPSVNEIVFLDDGIPKELLSNQYITDIKVDGSNNKWIGTFDSGIFYFSPDGQETIYHFTTDNSPLPSNTISDISIDSQSGKVYISTPKGLVSFLSGGSNPEEELSGAYVYPNPVRPEYNILGFNDLNNINNGVKIKGLTENVNIKITDVEGNLVAEAQSRINQRTSRANYNFAIDGGTAIWNGKNLANNVVASGVYLILISDLDSLETKVLKLAIIR